MRILSGSCVADRCRRGVLIGAVALAALLAGTRAGGDLVANGETRTLTIHHVHTQETVRVTYKRQGQFDRDALEKLNWALRDWRRDEPTSMDPRLFDIVWEVHRAVGSDEPLHVVSAYRSPETNAMLRRRSNGVAKHSQHTRGKALDFHLPDVSMQKVRDIALRLQRGGVGYYPSAYTPFVHLDAGSVRHWPKMNRDQLARVFPDGKTVHIPSDGRPMARYDEAYAEVVANGGHVFGAASYADAGETEAAGTPKSKGFFAWLFGGKDEEEDAEEAVRPRNRVVRPAPPREQRAPEEAKPVESVVVQKPASRVPAVVIAERTPPAAPLARSEPGVPQLVWQNGPAPLPPSGRLGNAPAPVTVAVLTSLASYRPADVPLPPAPDRPGVAVAQQGDPAPRLPALAGRAADVPLPNERPSEFRVAAGLAEATAMGSVRNAGPVALPPAITGGQDRALGSVVTAYAPGVGNVAPMPPTRPGSARSAAAAEAASRPAPARDRDAERARERARPPVERTAERTSAPAVETTGALRPPAPATAAATAPAASPQGILSGAATPAMGLGPMSGSLPTDRFSR